MALLVAATTAAAACGTTDKLGQAKDAVFYARDVATPMGVYASTLGSASPDGSVTPQEGARLATAAASVASVERQLRAVSPPDHLRNAHAQLVSSVSGSATALRQMSVAAKRGNRPAYQRASRGYAKSQSSLGTAIESIVQDSGIPIPEPPAGATGSAPAAP